MATAALHIQPEDKTVSLKLNRVKCNGITTAQNNNFYDFVLEGLSKTQKALHPKYLYDGKGSQLFEAICEVEEYYLTRTELSIMEKNIQEMAGVIGPNAVVLEPGSGAGVKIRLLLKALQSPAAYVPIEISSDALRRSTNILQMEFPDLNIYPLCGDFTAHLDPPDDLPTGHRVVYFPGSTIGNLTTPEYVRLLATFARLAGDGGGLLIGIDLDKDPEILYRAYNDSRGANAAFILNVLTRINHELGGNFDEEKFTYMSLYNEKSHQMEMRLYSKIDQLVQVDGHTFQFCKGESVYIEHSKKFQLTEFGRSLKAQGFMVQNVWTDSKKQFAILYCIRDGQPSYLYDPDEIADLYRKTWSFSDQLFQMLTPGGLLQQPIQVR
jgi:dimethylhistidine N-methyltransferase